MARTPNQDQQRVIDDFANNIILYASAGTGKTFTVAQKVKKIIENGLAKPEEILCLTFTIKACDEMHNDIISYNDKAQTVEVRTIHSFCYQVVNEEAKRASDSYIQPVICDEVDQEELLQRLIPDTIARLRLDEIIHQTGVIDSLDNLFGCDVVHLANTALTPTYAATTTRRSGFFWKIPYKNSTLYLSPDGVISEADAARMSPAPFVCPECKSRQMQSGNFCAECGYDLRTYIMPAEFALGKYGGYRNLISLIKHCRTMRGNNCGDEAEDFNHTFRQLKAFSPKELKKAFTFFHSHTERVDEELLTAMDKFAGTVLHEYQTRLRKNNRVDFDDLIIEARNFLLNPSVCGRWQHRYKYIIVDEMQDTSELEYDVLKRLFPRSRVMMCGDFFQTIYEWRGSNPRAVLEDYRRTFRARTYMLSENYRSTRLLTSASFGYLKNTYPADIGVFCPEEITVAAETAGDPIRLVECQSDREEAAFIFRYLRQHPVDDPTKICVMARTNNYIDKLAQFFNAFNATLPADRRLRFFTVQQDYRFFKAPVVKDMLAFWTLLVNPGDTLAMERIAEKYISSVGQATVKSVQDEYPTGLSLCSFLEDDTFVCGDPYRTLIDALKLGNVVVYDTETTGLDLGKDQIIQIAAIKTDRSGNCIQEFMRFIVPTVEISKGALDTHGYSLDYIKSHGGISAAEALKEFSDFVRGAVIVGHNSAKFDRTVVNRQLSECGLPPLDVKGEYDTLTLSKFIYPELKNHKLSTLCEKLGIINVRAHDAFADVEATAKVLARIVTDTLEGHAPDRERSVRRHKSRFKNFYAHFRAMHNFLSANDAENLNRYIIENFKIIERYNKDWERDSLDILLLLAKEKQEVKSSLEITLRDLLVESALAGSEMDVLIKKLNKIPVITVHQSKGCEFDTVLLAGVDNFMFPIVSAVNCGHEDEEKRVFYVAISRAKRTLIMTCHGNNSLNYPRLPSSYVDKIPQEYLARYICVGTTVTPK